MWRSVRITRFALIDDKIIVTHKEKGSLYTHIDGIDCRYFSDHPYYMEESNGKYLREGVVYINEERNSGFFIHKDC